MRMYCPPVISSCVILCLFFQCCKNVSGPAAGNKQVDDLPEIRQRGHLVVTTDFNSTNYFIYRGQPMGYTYELLQDLADHLQIPLDVVVSNKLEDNFDCLINGECDLIAVNLTVTRERGKIVDFTEPHSQTRQVLVQRKPDDWERTDPAELEGQLIRNQLELAGKTVYLQENSAYAARVRNLSEEIGETINCIEVPEEAETLITLVAEGEIDYTVCDENIALVNQTYYPNIDVATAVSFPQNLAWAVNKGADQLKDSIDSWLVAFKRTSRYRLIYNRYFKSQRMKVMVQSDFFAITSGRISEYDEAIKRYAGEIGWDWRLVASMIYQESRFDPGARSWAGAYGLMQLMPATASRFSLTRDSSPEDQIKAGIEFIRWLDENFRNEIPDENERVKFILAAYNAGPGHVADAMELARKYGKDPKRWNNNVEEYLLKKASPEYYQDPVAKYGYCRGVETVNYVSQVLERYEHYKNIIPPGETGTVG